MRRLNSERDRDKSCYCGDEIQQWSKRRSDYPFLSSKRAMYMAEYTEIFDETFSAEEKRGRINEGVREGLRGLSSPAICEKMRVHLFFIRENIYYSGG